MDLPVERWLSAAEHRTSRRAYDGRRVPEEKLDALEHLCRTFRPYPDARAVLVREPAADVFRGVVGSYGKVTNAPSVLVMLTTATSPGADRRVGYCGEAAVLEATALDIDTCWVGGFFDPRKAARLLSLEPGERIVAVSPVGHSPHAQSSSERTMRGLAGAHRRRELAQIAPDCDTWPGWARAAAEAVRIAPSAVNRQPWVLALEHDALVLSRDNRREWPGHLTKALDIGIASLHAELGARSAGTPGVWQDAEDPSGLEVCRYVVGSAG